ncbi:hypothetical protein ONZ45_g2544 [Pleurotus djamor]|nr:hypothetical protein ONZ45_g2544 [Pleurotus djamor]
MLLAMNLFCAMIPNSSVLSVLPQDIYDIIIDNFRDDRPSLKTCSLVASAWRSPSQRLLHRTMVFLTTMYLPTVQGVDGTPSVQIPASSQRKTWLLLNTSSHLLQYVRCLSIHGDPCEGLFRGRERVPYLDLSLVVFLEKLRTLVLPLLVNIELRNLTWTNADTDLQCALVSLLCGRFIKDVLLFGCSIPSNIPWLRFIGPQTRSLKLTDVTMINDPITERNAPVDDPPISSGSSLIELDIGEECGPPVGQWILHCAPSSKPTSCSWRESVATLSLHCRYGMENASEFFQAFSGLTTLKFSPYNRETSFPFHDLLQIPTLEFLHIRSFPPDELSWILPSFKPPDSRSTSSHRTVPTKLKVVLLEVWVENYTPVDLSFTLPTMDTQIREFDEVVASFPNVQVNLTITVSTFEVKDGPERVEYEETKKTLAELWTDLKALKLVGSLVVQIHK